MGNSDTQKHLYEAIHDEYERHYFDETSILFRQLFMFEPLWQEMDFSGLEVAELACGVVL